MSHHEGFQLGVNVKFHAFILLVLDQGDWSASHSIHFTPGEGFLYSL